MKKSCLFHVCISLPPPRHPNYGSFSGGVPLSLPASQTEVLCSLGSLHHPSPLHNMEPAGSSGVIPIPVEPMCFLFAITSGQVEGGTVRLFLNCQAADSTSIGRHQVGANTANKVFQLLHNISKCFNWVFYFSMCFKTCNKSVEMLLSESGV